MTNTKHDLPEQVVKESAPKESFLVHMEPQKIEEKQCHDSTPLSNSISSKHISDVPVNTDLTPSSVPHLAHLFDKAEKTGQKEKLR
ncbi:unnamed protein product [Rhizophagus irregularis]|nr:unnamed protein product [Rhizophagus irregularis]